VNEKSGQRSDFATGLAYCVVAYSTWGLLPIYWKVLGLVSAPRILSHRILWSAVFMAGFLTIRRSWGSLRALRVPRVRLLVGVSALLISINWLIYIYAVNAGRILEASLGYYIIPLVSVVLGLVFLKERLTRLQVGAVAAVVAGVAWFILRLGSVPWVSIVLAFSFGGYGFVKKKTGLDAMTALFVETAALAPICIAYLAWGALNGEALFGTSQTQAIATGGVVSLKASGAAAAIMLVLAGPVTALPLFWFARAIERMTLSAIGFIQYASPTLMLILGVFLYGEPLGMDRIISLALVWVGVALYLTGLYLDSRPKPAASAAKP